LRRVDSWHDSRSPVRQLTPSRSILTGGLVAQSLDSLAQNIGEATADLGRKPIERLAQLATTDLVELVHELLAVRADPHEAHTSVLGALFPRDVTVFHEAVHEPGNLMAANGTFYWTNYYPMPTVDIGLRQRPDHDAVPPGREPRTVHFIFGLRAGSKPCGTLGSCHVPVGV
jgi:hypothetical protein